MIKIFSQELNYLTSFMTKSKININEIKKKVANNEEFDLLMSR